MNGAAAERLNRYCECEARAAPGLSGYYSDVPVFVDTHQLGAMQQIVAAVHAVAALPAYRRQVLDAAPAISRVDPRALGVFNGFDFHLSAQGPRLIEINTNAGGALLNAAARWRLPAGCDFGELAPAHSPEALEREFVAMFRDEWRLARGEQPLSRIAIVDDEPEAQFLYPEFLLFVELLARQGIEVMVADAAQLRIEGGRLVHGGRSIDLVYNRLTDFYFEDPRHEALRRAYREDLAVITPHPRAHALLADKTNLVRLTDVEFLQSIGAGQRDIDILVAGIPRTRCVDEQEPLWWEQRKEWFFKPAHGFGSRGAYRGEKITRRVFADVLKGGYVAQQLAPASERHRRSSAGSEPFKVDFRCYVYDGRTQLLAARLYQGQTTNFRTAGGGFAPVMVGEWSNAEQLLERCGSPGGRES